MWYKYRDVYHMQPTIYHLRSKVDIEIKIMSVLSLWIHIIYVEYVTAMKADERLWLLHRMLFLRSSESKFDFLWLPF